jgi:ribosomal protein S18 acetylase RimI-like enzyme
MPGQPNGPLARHIIRTARRILWIGESELIQNHERICPSDDVALLAPVHAATVAFAYASFFPDEALPPTAMELCGTWAERVADPSATALVAFKSRRPIGSVMVRRDPDFTAEGQLLGLHVLPDAWGRGAGGALHDAALELLIEDDYLNAGLWVLAVNQRDRRMYEARQSNLRPGTEIMPSGLTEVRYIKPLSTEQVTELRSL